MDNISEKKIIQSVEAGYDQMAEKFSNTRKYFWNGFEFVLENVENEDVVLDYGSGNGRLLEILKNKNIQYFGVDISQKLIDLARKKYIGSGINFQKISGSHTLPFPDNFFNKVISISVFHHFPKKYANDVAKELYRITKPGGIVIISVWNLWQKKYWKYFFNLEVIKNKFFQSGEYRGYGLMDIIIPFKNNQREIFNRFHHIFSQKKLAKLFEKSGFQIEKSFVLDKKNIVMIGKKI